MANTLNGVHSTEAVVGVDINNLHFHSLNTKCLILASKYVRALNRQHGMVIRLQNSDALAQISKNAQLTKSPELRSIYHSLENEIKAYLKGPLGKNKILKLSQSPNKQTDDLVVS